MDTAHTSSLFLIKLLFLAALGLCCSWGLFFFEVHVLLIAVASLVVEQGSRARVFVVAVYRLLSMWSLLQQGIKPMSPALASGFSTTGPPGKSYTHPLLCRSEMAFTSAYQMVDLPDGRSRARVSELGELLQRFLLAKQLPLAAHFSDTEWIIKLAYLCDIVNLLDRLNLLLQGRTTIFKLADKVAAFKAKLKLWGQWVNIGIFDMFQTLAEILKETYLESSLFQLMHDHLPQLSKEFERYFPTTKDPQTGEEWLWDPLVNKPGESVLSVLEDQLLEITNDSGLKSMFQTTSNCHISGLKSRRSIPRLPQKHWKACFYFQHPIFVKKDLLQWQQQKQDYGVDWT